jgi:pimeloyl-ACP methyl ester carboxylesterase
MEVCFACIAPVVETPWSPRWQTAPLRLHTAWRTPRKGRARLRATVERLEASSSSKEEASGVRISEWKFRGFRSCYAFAGLEAGPSAPAVVLVHGFGANHRHFRSNILPLAARGLRVYAIDLLGFGKGDMPLPGTLDSTGEAMAYNFDYWSAQLRQFCKEIVRSPSNDNANEHPPIFFVANSIGSMVTMQASIDEKDLCSAHVFISPSLRQLNVRKRSWLQAVTAPIAMRILMYRPLGGYFLKSLARPDALRKVLLQAYQVSERVDAELVEILRVPALQPGALEVFLAFITFDDGPIPEDLLPQLDCPSLMLWGELDSFEPHRDGLALRHYATVERFVSLPGIGHCGHDEDPILVNGLILEFLDIQRNKKAKAML